MLTAALQIQWSPGSRWRLAAALLTVGGIAGCGSQGSAPVSAERQPLVTSPQVQNSARAAETDDPPPTAQVGAVEWETSTVAWQPPAQEAARTYVVHEPPRPPAMSRQYTGYDDEPPVARLPEPEALSVRAPVKQIAPTQYVATGLAQHGPVATQPAVNQAPASVPHATPPTAPAIAPRPGASVPHPAPAPAPAGANATPTPPRAPDSIAWRPGANPPAPSPSTVNDRRQALAPAEPRPAEIRLDPRALEPLSQQATLRVEEAFRLARRGALFAARAELIQSLRMISQGVDTLERNNRRSQALAAGTQAMKEAEDFYVGSDTLEHDLDLEGIVLAHRTPVLKGRPLAGISSLAALQQYYGFAQQQLAYAAAETPAGSRALYGLGKVHMTLARQSSDDRSHHTPKAMAYFQAAMQADGRNYLAANELGVLLAQFGQLHEARQALVQSVSVQSHVEGWQNLAIVHSRLGEHELASLANREHELLIARSTRPADGSPVQWVAPSEFNSLAGPDALATSPAARNAPPRQAATSRTAPNPSTRR